LALPGYYDRISGIETERGRRKIRKREKQARKKGRVA
jgi:hypothetical protein